MVEAGRWWLPSGHLFAMIFFASQHRLPRTDSSACSGTRVDIAKAAPKIFQQIEADALDILSPLLPRPPHRNEPLPMLVPIPPSAAMLSSPAPALRRFAFRSGLRKRHEAQDAVVVACRAPAPVAVRGRKIDRAVRPFRHVANAPVIFNQHALLADDAATV